MLLFIGKATGESVRKELFQYISCYSLSASTFKNRSEYWRFNTSHVTLYRKENKKLMYGNTVSIHLMLLFINPQQNECSSCSKVSIHLMLLFITKTYTVTVTKEVSIHLMLLFIMPLLAMESLL